eukprot:GHVR01086478.1.p1 GENE.GHVR01086478.1~~GHVR01086478.1.p1  ORF type:complete len:848 (-),score=219.31 GHVR01086478.1:16-2310(-)
MAVDGVAPRAKMNQQRSRRFRAAFEAQEAKEKEKHSKGTNTSSSTSSWFTSNAITPGTKFMQNLTKQLHYFVHMKINTDSAWRGVNIIISGPDVPGEGEHKIMDYIRSIKSQVDYDVNTRHCLYGLDADLIMLALASHEPHFTLLREEIIFGKTKTKTTESRVMTSKDIFQLLHISLVREYLKLEFTPKENPKFVKYDYDGERVIDDFIVFCFLIGNDFLPHLCGAEIGERCQESEYGGLSAIMQCYKEHLVEWVDTTCTPWLTSDCGKVQWHALYKFFDRWKEHEKDSLTTQIQDSQWMSGKVKSCLNDEHRMTRQGRVKECIEPYRIPAYRHDQPHTHTHKHTHKHTHTERPRTTDQAIRIFYMKKLGFDMKTSEGLSELSKLSLSYLMGIQWNLLYYYRGCPSWSWFYPYHYPPFVHNLLSYDPFKLNRMSEVVLFDLGKPFRPFQQLLAVLPPSNADLLPSAYRSLMDVSSTLSDFYPHSFDIDMDGVKVPWGGVTLISFIEESRLINSMDAIDDKSLSEDEKDRNKIGNIYLFKYNKSSNMYIKSLIPLKLPSIKSSRVSIETYTHPPFPHGVEHFPSYPLEGCVIPQEGFPSLLEYNVECTLGKDVKVFSFESKDWSLILNVRRKLENESVIENILRSHTVQFDYPYIHIGKVISVTLPHTFGFKEIILNNLNNNKHNNNRNNVNKCLERLKMDMRRKGVNVNMFNFFNILPYFKKKYPNYFINDANDRGGAVNNKKYTNKHNNNNNNNVIFSRIIEL